MIPDLEKRLSSPYCLFMPCEQGAGAPPPFIQHQPLIHLQEELFEGFYDGNGHELIGKTLLKLKEYADTTLAEIEEFLLIYGYSGIANVRALHNQLVAQTQKWNDEYLSGANILSFELYQFIRQWHHDYVDCHGHLMKPDQHDEFPALLS